MQTTETFSFLFLPLFNKGAVTEQALLAALLRLQVEGVVYVDAVGLSGFGYSPDFCRHSRLFYEPGINWPLKRLVS